VLRRVTIGSHLTALAVVVLGVAVLVPVGLRADATTTRHASTSWPTSCPGQPDSIDQSATMSGDVTQSLDGSIVGCFRVPDDRQSTLHVAWQSYVALLTAPGSVTPTKVSATSSSASPGGSFTLSIASHTVRPGERIEVSGHYVHGHRPANSGSVTICWNGCQSGLQELGVTLHWSSLTEFHVALVVPDAPWYVVYHGRPSVHPLASGTYAVGIECIASNHGCALGGADAQVHVHLVAPTATWCTAHVPCGSLRLSATSTTIGDVVEVRGRAPLVTLIGQPSGYWLDLSSSNLGSRPVAFTGIAVTEDLATIAPRNLTVDPGQTWESLHLSPVTLSSWSSPSPVNPTPASPLVAWCEPGAVVVTGGAHPYRVPTTGAARLLASNHLSLSGSAAVSPCVSATVEPGSPEHVFAVFTALRNEIPRASLAGIYTSDGGVTWHLVPSPPGHAESDFGGFHVVGRHVEALFANRNGNAAYVARTTVATEATSNGGVTWSASTLGCANNGPCTTFGPYVPDNCAMTSQPEAVLVGPARGPPSGVSFSESRWVTEVDTCYSQQLTATATGLELLADPSSIYPLLASSDGGITWYNVRLPVLTGLGAPGGSEESLVLTTNDTLVASVETSGVSPAVRLFLLRPRASSWCRVRGIPPASGNQLVTPLRTNGDGLLWGQYPVNKPNPVVARHFVAWSDLQC
jgi:hypothetical protein